MLSLSCIAWLSVVLVQAIFYFKPGIDRRNYAATSRKLEEASKPRKEKQNGNATETKSCYEGHANHESIRSREVKTARILMPDHPDGCELQRVWSSDDYDDVDDDEERRYYMLQKYYDNHTFLKPMVKTMGDKDSMTGGSFEPADSINMVSEKLHQKRLSTQNEVSSNQ
jgi:hypothetical protein